MSVKLSLIIYGIIINLSFFLTTSNLRMKKNLSNLTGRARAISRG